jgi:hypothetical protein
MTTESSGYSIFPGDITCYTLKCFKCGQSVSPHGSIREILMHAPLVTIHHWDMIQPKDWDMIQSKDDIDDNEIDSMPLFVTSSEGYMKSKKILEEA